MYENRSKYYFGARWKSFKFALNGLKIFFKTQPHSKIHAVAILVVLFAGWFFRLSLAEWCSIIFAIGLVVVTEVINTAIEFLTDLVSPEYNKKAGAVKDLAAASVLIASLISVIIAGFIFLPKLF